MKGRSEMEAFSARVLEQPLELLMAEAEALRDRAVGTRLTYSRKVFIPLTQLCRDVCHYCVFARRPLELTQPYLSPDDVLAIAQAGAALGCKEALFTLGDKPELRYATARQALNDLGFGSTLAYLEHVARLVRERTGLLPHLNPGVMTGTDYARLRTVSVSMGLMLESSSERLCAPGLPHYGSPDKQPHIRLQSIEKAGAARVPFTTGLLIGIGETRKERFQSLVALHDLHLRHGHLQEIIIQNFKPKPGTKMANAPEPHENELLWTIAVARLLFGASLSIQTPPNLNQKRIARLIAAGIDDWGGISPVTIDHVNPEAPWPEIDSLASQCAANGHMLVERLAIYPRFVKKAEEWTDHAVRPAILAHSDSDGYARDTGWSPGGEMPVPRGALGAVSGISGPKIASHSSIEPILGRAERGEELSESEIVRLFSARGSEARDILVAADTLRKAVNGNTVTFVTNRNINYTNICTFHCAFCAFSKTSTRAGTRDKPYVLLLEEIAARAREAWDLGASEVCLQGGIHPKYTGETYLEICRTLKQTIPNLHIHAFSPLEVAQGAATTGRSVRDFLARLKDEGLGSLPGTAAEILHDEVRAILCPDKIGTEEWLEIVATAHDLGIPTTSTIMFGHLDDPRHWAAHLLAIRRLQTRTGGFTEFVPLPFVHMQSPVFLKGMARRGPTWREAILMHAVARLVLYPLISHIQASWVKLGLDGALAALEAGADDLGGTLINESISRAAGASHGQSMSVATLRNAIAGMGREPKQRTTLYHQIDEAAGELVHATAT